MTDVYKAPSSNLEMQASGEDLQAFERFSAWGVFFLSIVTLGIYSMYWMFSRTKVLNRISDQGISSPVIWITLVAYIIIMVLSYGGAFLLPAEIAVAVQLFAVVAYFIFMLIWIFGFRAAIVSIARSHGQPDFRANGVLTFFFQALYMQYKINQFIDRK
ncbi:DUF4234 domain-containing protein [Gynuella sunshinyii]|uniref:DUF4234 domain-containing protein n=1 Tax=Gynuella sunshinyii YC6258 TaxID=1445510 RepID=A0A0C5VX34_9GAMM|nr:DUF4234 domain-containing protein [Gynuella sunshinyii]AJQ97878.1 hypothetical Protein YC6258_05850 [Gynuella sunshinyii YC6258]